MPNGTLTTDGFQEGRRIENRAYVLLDSRFSLSSLKIGTMRIMGFEKPQDWLPSIHYATAYGLRCAATPCRHAAPRRHSIYRPPSDWLDSMRGHAGSSTAFSLPSS